MEITHLLKRIGDGDQTAFDELYPRVYQKLKSLAQAQLNREYRNHTLCKTELVHEAYEKMVEYPDPDYQNKTHFYAIAAKSMRQILVDYARKKNALKRGGEYYIQNMDMQEVHIEKHAHQIIVFDELLDELKNLDERMASVVELRFFGGMSIEDTAETLGISPSTANRDWLKARGWLFSKLQDQSD
jgi:RNA polymerase sigma factor (TIGR02999 family)